MRPHHFIKAEPIATGGAVARMALLRSCLASMLGHAVAIVAMAFLTYGDGEGSAASRPLLVASVTDQPAPLELQSLISAPEQVHNIAAVNSVATWTEEAVDLKGLVAEPAIGLFGQTSAPQASTLLPPLLDKEFVEKPSEQPRKIGRSANFYGIEADGSKFVFVVDMSGSMSGSRFRRARTELCQTIEHLDPAQAFYVIGFNDLPSFMPSNGLAAVTPASLQLLHDWLKQVECQGGTEPLPALFAALAMKPDAVFLLSDGKFDPELAAAVSQLNASNRIPIHTIGFASRKGEPMLRAISKVSGGTYRYVR